MARYGFQLGLDRAVTGRLVGFALLACLLVGACNAGEGPVKDRNRDRRALLGSDPGITLDRSMSDHGLFFPLGAREVRFKTRHDGSAYWLQMAFRAPCRQSAEAFQRSHLEKRSGKTDDDIVALSQLADVAGKFSLPDPDSTSHVLYSDNGERFAVAEKLDGTDCRLLVSASK